MATPPLPPDDGRRAARRRGLRRALYLAPVVLFLLLAVAFWLGLGRDPSALPSAMIDKPVPSFDLPALEGRTASEAGGLSDADLRQGRPALVNVFASWCPPCRVEHPLLMEIAREGRVTVHGIAQRDRPEDTLAFLEELGDPYDRVGVDRDARVSIDFGVYGVPETYLVDGAGRIRWRWAGPLTPDIVAEELEPRLRELSR